MLTRFLKRFAGPLAAAAVFLAASPAGAVGLTLGAFASPTGTDVGADPSLAGVVLADRVDNYSFDGGAFTGTVQSRVVRSNTLGTLDFYWRVSSTTGSIGSFRLGLPGFVAYEGDYRTDSLGSVAPGSIYAFDAPNVGSVNFGFFRNPISDGAESYFMYLRSTATAFDYVGLMDVTNLTQTVISDLMMTYAPVAAPEPATAALLALGLVGVAARRRRRNR
jgi:hypothetical protein